MAMKSGSRLRNGLSTFLRTTSAAHHLPTSTGLCCVPFATNHAAENSATCAGAMTPIGARMYDGRFRREGWSEGSERVKRAEREQPWRGRLQGVGGAFEPSQKRAGRSGYTAGYSTSSAPLAWTSSRTRKAIMFAKGASAATFASTVVAAAAMSETEPAQCAEAQKGKLDDADGDMVTIPSVGGTPDSKTGPHSSICGVSSNTLWEDRCVVHAIRGRSGAKEFYFAVLDGHGGWDCAEFVYPLLTTSISECLAAMSDNPSANDVEACITQGFLKVEETWTKRLKSEWLRQPNYVTYGTPGTERLSAVGSCVLLACVHGNMLYVANLGDSRAVIAQKGFGGSFRAQRVTSDLNAMNTTEQERLKRDHPGEPDIFRCRGPYSCYVKGCLQPTYSLGDAYLKYPFFNNFPGRVVPEPYKPPYIRSAPQITARPLSSVSEGDFLILATDGVWDYLSDQNAVDLVNRANRRGTNPAEAVVEATLELAASRFGISREQLTQMAPGRQRRRIHDDATVIVIDLHAATQASMASAPAPGAPPAVARAKL